MSEISHSDELVTKQDLSNFYQGILPYLGGMPEMLANKFSKGDLYSTDEKMIGQWINGKPIYQKTMTVKAPTVTTQGTQAQTSTPHNISNIESRLGCALMGSSNVQIFGSANNTYFLSAYFDTTNLYIRANNNTWNGVNITITMRYTKTTDSAISIGSDTDYSTEEKIVGTWIDGRPLYQKTVVVTSPASAGVDTIVASFDASMQPREMIGLLDNTIPLNYNGTNEWYTKTRLEPSFSNSVVTGINIRMIVAGYTNRVTRITIRYTKTTD